MARTTDSATKRLYTRRPTFSASGTTVMPIGKSRYKLDPSWQTMWQENNQLLWVMLPPDDLRLLCESGEVVGIPPDIIDAVKRRFFS
jgi:hypothetical protein